MRGRRRIDLTGRRFGRWLVLREHLEPRARRDHVRWLCRCGGCGTEHVVIGFTLYRGESKGCSSCGHVKHGHAHRGRPTRIYRIWCRMLQRCYNPNYTGYSNWGGRGICVCERWHDFLNFLADMGEPPPGKSIDRKNNDGDYEPGNCRWATHSEQNRNQRPRKKKLRIKLGDPKILAGLKQLNESLTRLGART
jgi:hypothetical protein